MPKKTIYVDKMSEPKIAALQNLMEIRIVTIDYYLAKPVQSLDPCYSELKTNVIKQVNMLNFAS